MLELLYLLVIEPVIERPLEIIITGILIVSFVVIFPVFSRKLRERSHSNIKERSKKREKTRKYVVYTQK